MNGTLPPSSDPLDRIEAVRQQLKSVTDDEEDTGRIEVPHDAPMRAKVFIAVYGGLPPWQRGLVLLAILAMLFFGGAEFGGRLGWW